MKKIKKLMTLVISAVMLISSSVTALGYGTYGGATGKPIILQSDITDSVSAAQKLGIITSDTDTSSVVTRKELCRLFVRFYRAATGSTGITLFKSPYLDCDANEVAFCSENGIMKGISSVTFAPDNYVSRQEVCSYVVNIIKFCGVDISNADDKYNMVFKDKSDISDEYAGDVKYLASIGVINGYDGYFYPESYITYNQAASILVEIYYQLMLNKIEINGSTIAIGDSSEKAVLAFGMPSYTFYDSQSDMTIWVYNKNLKRLFYIGMDNNAVAEVFSNSEDFEYRGVSAGSNAKEVNFGARCKMGTNGVTYTDGHGTVDLGWNPANGKICYIHARSTNNLKRHSISKETVDNDTSLLYDIINAERAKAGLNIFTINKLIESSARQHSLNMEYWKYLDYNNRYDLTPFERLKEKGINYVMAAENIASGNSIKDIYASWMNNSGSRSNMLSGYMDNVGIGLAFSSNDKKAYATLDLVKLKNIIS